MKSGKFLTALKRPIALLLAVFMLFAVVGCSAQEIEDFAEIADALINSVVTETDNSAESEAPDVESDSDPPITEAEVIDEDGYYYSRDEVALYIYTYGKLPENFITKNEAEDLGWEGGSVERFRDGAAIGGDKFGNREGLLPKSDGRVYYECDIDTNGKSSRGAKRIVYSNDGLIFYTDDHYESFTQLYGEE